MSCSDKLKAYVQRFWAVRAKELSLGAETLSRYEKALEDCSEEEAIFLKYVLSTVPLSDLADYKPELFRKTVRSAMEARHSFSWCGALPEHLFLLYVLSPRINNEELSDCREVFREALIKRISGLSLPEAVLEVNRWCGENVTYRSTDDRTSSALDIFERGYGRCGEESVFTVNALRSVGIAARQIYAPWWSHCDDNHAWVEAFDGERWRYLGACEPEPELDRGWFTSAASRAMLIHTRAFAAGEREDWSFLFPEADAVDVEKTDGAVYETVSGRYAETRRVTVTVLDRSGTPVSGAAVRFLVLNMAGFREIAVRKTGQNGKAVLRLGLGSVLIRAGSAEKLLDASLCDHAELILSEEAPAEDDGTEFLFRAPAGAAGYPAPLSPEAKARRRETLDRCVALREKRQADRAREKAPELSDRQRRIVLSLTEKDRAGAVPPELLADAFPAFDWEEKYPPEVFEQALLCPRIGSEPLGIWREKLFAAFSQRDREDFRREPQLIWSWIEANIRDSGDFSSLCGTPAGCFSLKAANEAGKRALFCAVCRAMGVPARLSPADREPEYWENGGFCGVFSREMAEATLTAPSDQPGLAGQNFGISRVQTGEDGKTAILSAADIPQGESRRMKLPTGTYCLLTVCRLPGGDQLVRSQKLLLRSGADLHRDLEFRKGKLSDLLECLALPPFLLENADGKEQDSVSLLKRSAFSLMFWLEPGREPTEHILNELRECAESVKRTGCGVHFILEDRKKEQDPALRRACSCLPEAQLWYGDFQDTASALARRVYADPDKLPLILLVDCKGNSLYTSSGYNVGTAELLVRLLEALSKN